MYSVKLKKKHFFKQFFSLYSWIWGWQFLNVSSRCAFMQTCYSPRSSNVFNAFYHIKCDRLLRTSPPHWFLGFSSSPHILQKDLFGCKTANTIFSVQLKKLVEINACHLQVFLFIYIDWKQRWELVQSISKSAIFFHHRSAWNDNKRSIRFRVFQG